MALVRWNPNRQNVASPRNINDDIECFLEDYFSGQSRPWHGQWSTPTQTRTSYTPRVDLVNNEKEIVLKADLPGIDKDDLDITVTNDVVTLKGERKSGETTENECYYCQESSYGSFERSIPLPDKVLSDEAQASLKNGVLTLTLPKSEPQGAFKVKVN